MIINHPILGPRDAQEFVYLGDAALIDRPDGLTDPQEFHAYAYLRDPGHLVDDVATTGWFTAARAATSRRRPRWEDSSWT